MTNIRIRKVEGTWVVRSGGAVLGESANALELSEGDMAPVIYLPRNDIAMAFLDRSEKTTTCAAKGDATYFSIVNKSSISEHVDINASKYIKICRISCHYVARNSSGSSPVASLAFIQALAMSTA